MEIKLHNKNNENKNKNSNNNNKNIVTVKLLMVNYRSNYEYRSNYSLHYLCHEQNTS